MTPVELIRDACGRPLTSEDGDSVAITLQPACSDVEIAELEATLPCPMPQELLTVLRHCRGFQGGGVARFVDFTGKDCMYEQLEIFPHGFPIAGDVYGNSWVVDLSPNSTTCGPIYYACHDAPVILFQSPSLEHFLVELFKSCLPPHRSLVVDVHEDSLFEVWNQNPGVVNQEACLKSNDPVLSAFARELDASFQIIDLREAKIGSGFSWGRYGPRTVIRRYGMAPIFAYQRRKGLLSRLFGRSEQGTTASE